MLLRYLLLAKADYFDTVKALSDSQEGATVKQREVYEDVSATILSHQLMVHLLKLRIK